MKIKQNVSHVEASDENLSYYTPYANIEAELDVIGVTED